MSNAVVEPRVRNRDTVVIDASHLKDGNLAARAVRSGAVTLTSQWIVYVLGVVSLSVMARLLTPDDYGKVAMVTAITGFASVFKDLGLSTATIQREKITHAQLSTLFWVNVGFGTLVMLAVMALSPLVAWFYHTPELSKIMVALSVTFLLGGLTVQHQAILTRQMRFTTSSIVNVISVVAGIVCGVTGGFMGLGYWAIVMGYIATSLTMAVGMWMASKWRPGLPMRGCGIRSMLGFGAHISSFNVVNYFSRNADNVLIGRFAGSSALGIYSRAYQLLLLPIANLRNPLNSVALPTLSRLVDDPARYKSHYQHFIGALAFISMPMVACMYVYSTAIVSIVLGSRWLGASELFRLLAISAFIQPVVSTRGTVMLSTGQGRRLLTWGLVNAVATVVGFAIGVRWGAIGVATSYAIVNYAVLLPGIWYTTKCTPVTTLDFFRAMWKPTLASVGAACICMLLPGSQRGIAAVWTLLLGTLAFCASYLVIWRVLPGGAHDLREYISYGKAVVTKRELPAA
jgi:O-antigen/teichoic acid export membrane protein